MHNVIFSYSYKRLVPDDWPGSATAGGLPQLPPDGRLSTALPYNQFPTTTSDCWMAGQQTARSV